MSLLDSHHWDNTRSQYLDWGLHTEAVRLVKTVRGHQQGPVEVRVTHTHTHTRTHAGPARKDSEGTPTGTRRGAGDTHIHSLLSVCDFLIEPLFHQAALQATNTNIHTHRACSTPLCSHVARTHTRTYMQTHIDIHTLTHKNSLAGMHGRIHRAWSSCTSPYMCCMFRTVRYEGLGWNGCACVCMCVFVCVCILLIAACRWSTADPCACGCVCVRALCVCVCVCVGGNGTGGGRAPYVTIRTALRIRIAIPLTHACTAG